MDYMQAEISKHGIMFTADSGPKGLLLCCGTVLDSKDRRAYICGIVQQGMLG